MKSTLKGKPKNEVAWPRLSTRVFPHQNEYVKKEAKRLKGKVSEGEIWRSLLDEAINSRKEKSNAGN